jgi:carbamoyltransferase
MSRFILGISCFYHDSAAAIIKDGVVIGAAQEERFTRVKHDASFPIGAISYCLCEAAISIDQLDAVVYYDKPLLKFERLLETYYANAPKGLLSFLKSMPVWIKEKMFLKREIRKGLSQIQDFDPKKLKLLFTEHHLSHAASTFYPSPFNKAAILTIDGVGEWATASIGFGEGPNIKVLKELHFPHSVGLLYSAFTYYLGFRVNSGEYKLMGLAPYADAQGDDVQHFVYLIKEHLVTIRGDGSIFLNQAYFDYATGLKMIKEAKWETLFGVPKRMAEEDFNHLHCALAGAIQAVTEEIVIKMAKEAKRLTGASCLCLSGGVALNCVANGKLVNEEVFERVYVQPASGDAGGALGAALAAYYLYFQQDRLHSGNFDEMQGAYLGPAADSHSIKTMVQKYGAIFQTMDDSTLTQHVASLIAAGQVVGWFQGRMEFGPRALGNRSILGDPRNEDMQRRINLKIKYRESFRPFAPAVLEEDAQEFFQMKTTSPYMLQVHALASSQIKKLPDNYHAGSMREKLYQSRTKLQAITHVDLSARVQTVSRSTNPIFWQLINDFKKLTAYPVLINTSFNVRGEPIVCTAEDAYRCFMRTEMDYLVINNHVFSKTTQPAWDHKDHWQEEFVLD